MSIETSFRSMYYVYMYWSGRLIDVIMTIEIIVMITNNRDVEKILKNLNFVTAYKRKVLNFRANVMPKFSNYRCIIN